MNKFSYKGKMRIAKPVRETNGGILHSQVYPEVGWRTFKTDEMVRCRRAGFLTIWFYVMVRECRQVLEKLAGAQ